MRGQQQEQQQPQQQQQHWMQSGAPLGFVEVGSGDGAGRYLASHGGSAQNTNQVVKNIDASDKSVAKFHAGSDTEIESTSAREIQVLTFQTLTQQ